MLCQRASETEMQNIATILCVEKTSVPWDKKDCYIWCTCYYLEFCFLILVSVLMTGLPCFTAEWDLSLEPASLRFWVLSAAFDSTCKMLLQRCSAGGGHNCACSSVHWTRLLVAPSTKSVQWVPRCREVWNCKLAVAVVNVDIPAVWSQFGQSVLLAPPGTGMKLGINWSMQTKPIAREANTLKIPSVNAGLHLNITICLDYCSKSSASFLCLYMVAGVWFGKITCQF